MKKAMRFVSLLGVAALMLFVLTACSSAEDPGSFEDLQPQGEDEVDPDDGQEAGNTADKTYIVYSDVAFAPYEFLDEETGEYVGIDVELLAAIAEDQGFKIEMRYEGFDAAMGAVQTGQADAMIAGMTITDDRLLTFDFSDGYIEDGQIMVVPAGSGITSLEDLRGENIATKLSTMSRDYVLSVKEEYELLNTDYEDSPIMYQAVINGNNAACFEDRNVIEWAIKSADLPLETVGDVLSVKEYGFAVKKGENAELIEMFNAGLQNLKDSGQYDEIIAKYTL